MKRDPISAELDTPITPGGLLDRALSATQLPPRGDQPWGEYVQQFTDAETWRLVQLAIDAARRADFDQCVHWLRQADARVQATPAAEHPTPNS